MARDVVSYLITADDQTKAATQSAKTNLTGLRESYASLQNTMRGLQIGAAIGGIVLAARQAGEAVSSLVNIRAEMERLRSTLSVGVGAENVGKELDFLRSTADKFGLSFADVSIEYGKFAAASRGTAVEGQATRDIFLGMSKASAALGSSAEDSAGALRALQQMISKGKVSAEELNGQLGERLPGAMQIAARAMGMPTSALMKMMETGSLLTEDFIPKFTRQLELEFGPAADKAIGGAAQQLNRLGNEWQRLKEVTAGGFIGEGALRTVTGFTANLALLNRQLDSVGKGWRNYLGMNTSGMSNDDLDRTEKGLYNNDPSAGFAGPSQAQQEEMKIRAREKAQARFDALGEKYKTPAQKQKLINEEIRKAGKEAQEAGAKVSNTDIERLVGQAQPKGGESKAKAAAEKAKREAEKAARDEAALEKEKMEGRITAIESTAKEELAVYARAQDMQEAQRSAGLVGESAYYEQRRLNIEQSAGVRINALRLENEELGASKVTGKERIDLDAKVAKNQSEMARLRADAVGQMLVLDVQEVSSLTKKKQAYEDAYAAANDYVTTAERGYQRELQGATEGPTATARRQGEEQINDRYLQQRQQLASEKRTGAFDQKPGEYENQLRILADFQQEALSGWRSYYDARQVLEQSAQAGAVRALRAYADEAKNSAAEAGNIVRSTMGGLEDFLLQGGNDHTERDELRGELGQLRAKRDKVLASGKKQEDKDELVEQIDDKIASVEDRLKSARSDFQQLIDQFQQDIQRMLLRKVVLGAFASWLGNVMGGGGATSRLGGGMSVGGAGFGSQNDFSMSTGTNYVPYDGLKATLHKGEAVVPAKYNPSAGGGGGGVTLVQTINFNGDQGGASGVNQKQLARVIGDVAVARLAESQQRGIA